ncbi:MAG: signal peptidase I [bacterium]
MDEIDIKKSKEPWLAVNISSFFPGIGQIYSGRIARGFFIIFIQIALLCYASWLILIPTGNIMISAGLLLTFFIICIWNLFDAHKCAKKRNSEDFEKLRKKNKDPWLAVYLSQILPGLGHMYLKKWLWGIFFVFGLFVFSIIKDFSPLFLVSGVIFKAFTCFHAYKSSPIRREQSKNFIIIFVIIIFAVCLAVEYLPITFTTFIKENIVQAYKIPAGSMLETLQIGDHLLVKKFAYYLKEPERGDIVVFKYPKDQKRDFIKRIIGLPGEKIEIKDKKVFINGKQLNEPYVEFKDFGNIFDKNHPAYYIDPYAKRRDNIGPEYIPSDSYFVMGDNRDFSQDSRYWGFVNRELIKGKAYKIYWPPDRIGPIE